MQKSIEELKKLIRIREDALMTERGKERDVMQKKIVEGEQRTEMQAKKIQELTKVIHELTEKTKNFEASKFLNLRELQHVDFELLTPY